MSTPKLRLDIQGLRALAVALVVIFHLTPKTVPGGYIGVDVFFVISGFLITAHLLREVTQTGRVRLVEFWARRVRRLLPAAFLVLAASAIAVYFVFPETFREQNFTELAFAAVYALNWRLASDSVDYLAADNVPSLAQHYWSLSVEEQFYIVWPLLIIMAIWVATRSRRISREQAITGVLIVVFVASLAFSIFETMRSQPSAYFVTTTRAWEFAVGGLVAIIPVTSAAKFSPIAHVVMSWLGLVAIIGAAFLYNGASPFPGWIALVPVAGTALLLWIGDTDHIWSPQFLAKAGPIQLIGGNSYAIYLWHWPIIIIATSLLGRPPGWIWGILIIAVTVGLAIATKYFVEDPVRRATGVIKLRLPTFGLMAAGMAVILAMTITPNIVSDIKAREFLAHVYDASTDEAGCFGAFATFNNCPEPFETADTVNAEVSSVDGPWPYILENPACSSVQPDDQIEYFCDIEGPSDTSVMMYGDSHLYSLFPAFLQLAERDGWNVKMNSRSSCPGFGPILESAPPAEAERCAAWSEESLQAITEDQELDIVVISSFESAYPDATDDTIRTIERIQDSGKKVLVLRDVPGMEPGAGKGPACVEAAAEQAQPCSWSTKREKTWIDTAISRTGAESSDLWDPVCRDGVCQAVVGGTIVYRDKHHVTATFARTLAPWVRESVSNALAS